MNRTALWMAVAAGVAVWIAVGQSRPGASVKFTDITSAAGMNFVHNSGRAGKKYLPETLGSGGAFIDYDNDGWPDIILINGKDWTRRGHRSLPSPYHNTRNRTFTDLTRGSGRDVALYWIALAIGHAGSRV